MASEILYGTQQVAKILGVSMSFVMLLYREKKYEFPKNKEGKYYKTKSKALKQWLHTKQAKLFSAFVRTYLAISEAYKVNIIDKKTRDEFRAVLRNAKTIEVVNSIYNELLERGQSGKRRKFLMEDTVIEGINEMCKLLTEVQNEKIIGIEKKRARAVEEQLYSIIRRIRNGEL